MDSPVKRRALASLDANAMVSPKPVATALKASSTGTSTPLSSPLKDTAPEGRKRALDGPTAVAASPAAKKTCVERDEQDVPSRSGSLSRSHSPDTSSVFDTSAGDASWATAATADEPDVLAERIPPPTRPRALTREQAREKAEILRLRLGLASYKLHTGQITVPLADLQLKPFPQRLRLHGQRSAAQQQPHSPPQLPPPRRQAQEQADESAALSPEREQDAEKDKPESRDGSESRGAKALRSPEKLMPPTLPPHPSPTKSAAVTAQRKPLDGEGQTSGA